MGTGGTKVERFGVRPDLEFGFDAKYGVECILVSQREKVGVPAVVCLDLKADVTLWNEKLQALSYLELKMIWMALSTYPAPEYTLEQVRLLVRLRLALGEAGIHIRMPVELKWRFRELLGREMGQLDSQALVLSPT